MPHITTLLSHPDKATERELAKYYAAPFNMEELYQKSLAKARGEAVPQKKAAPSIYHSPVFRAVTAAACLLLTVGMVSGVWAKLRRIEPIPPEEPTDVQTAASETETSAPEPSGSETTPVVIVPGETDPMPEEPTDAPQPVTDPTEPPEESTSAPTQSATAQTTDPVQPTQKPTGAPSKDPAEPTQRATVPTTENVTQSPTEPCIEKPTQRPTQPQDPTEAWAPTEAWDLSTESPTEPPANDPPPTVETDPWLEDPTEAYEPTEGADPYPGFHAVWNMGTLCLTYTGQSTPSPDRYILYVLPFLSNDDVSPYTEDGAMKYRITMPSGNVCYVKQMQRDVYQIVDSWHGEVSSVSGYNATILIKYQDSYKLFWDDGYYTFCATGDNTDELLQIRTNFRKNPDGTSV